jgi:hypothetical protein
MLRAEKAARIGLKIGKVLPLATYPSDGPMGSGKPASQKNLSMSSPSENGPDPREISLLGRAPDRLGAELERDDHTCEEHQDWRRGDRVLSTA